ncbi:MAG: CRISPR-associated protein Cas2 [Spirochaetes bacterium]|nr:CRISPR-associated protein Cas2 [Spirochaetota bacterium]
MFVSVVYDLSSDDTKQKVKEILIFYRFKEIVKNVFESDSIQENTLKRLKRDIDRATDHFDKVRFYQYPYEQQFVISLLEKKKWKKILLR